MKSLQIFINEDLYDDAENYKKTYGKQFEIPKIYVPSNEEDLKDLLNSISDTEKIDNINDTWIKYNKKIFKGLGPWKLFDDSNNGQPLPNTICFGDYYGIGLRSEGFCLLLIEKLKTNKGVITKIKYNYNHSFFYNLIELMKSKDIIYNYFCKEDSSYALSDNLSHDELKKLPNAKQIYINEKEYFID